MFSLYRRELVLHRLGLPLNSLQDESSSSSSFVSLLTEPFGLLSPSWAISASVDRACLLRTVVVVDFARRRPVGAEPGGGDFNSMVAIVGQGRVRSKATVDCCGQLDSLPTTLAERENNCRLVVVVVVANEAAKYEMSQQLPLCVHYSERKTAGGCWRLFHPGSDTHTRDLRQRVSKAEHFLVTLNRGNSSQTYPA